MGASGASIQHKREICDVHGVTHAFPPGSGKVQTALLHSRLVDSKRSERLVTATDTLEDLVCILSPAFFLGVLAVSVVAIRESVNDPALSITGTQEDAAHVTVTPRSELVLAFQPTVNGT